MDDLLPYYERELTFFRDLCARFRDDHQKIAGRLWLDEGGQSTDPHVERLIHAFAYLSARTRAKIEDDFPEITEALLGVLYPHYQAPIPSMAIAQFELDPAQNQLTAGHPIDPLTELETVETVQGESCRFRTCYPVKLYPVEVKSAALGHEPFQKPSVPLPAPAGCVLHLVIGTRADDAPPLGAFEMTSLRFFLNGQAQHVARLYEMILNGAMAVALAKSPSDRSPVVLKRDCLRPVGFEPAEAVLPDEPRSFPAYRLLTEFFTFPSKFLFFDLTGLSPTALARAGSRLEVFIYLKEPDTDLQQHVTADTFRLGCAPIINLYKRRCDALTLSQTQYEYHVVPDHRSPLAHEIYSIKEVVATAPGGAKDDYQPFFSVKHAADARSAKAYWHASRRPVEGGADPGTEIYLSLVDLDFKPSGAAGWRVDVDALCLNRDLPQRVGVQPQLRFVKGGALVSSAGCLARPTPTLRPARKRGALWRLISHLSLNHLSLTGGADDERTDALREILKLYDFADSPRTRQMIDGVMRVRGVPAPGRPHGPGARAGALCRGLNVFMHFDDKAFKETSLFLFASVLERFLGLYCSINSFTRLIATVEGREGEWCRWQPRVGELTIL